MLYRRTTWNYSLLIVSYSLHCGNTVIILLLPKTLPVLEGFKSVTSASSHRGVHEAERDVSWIGKSIE